MAPISVSFARPVDFRVFKTMGLPVACIPRRIVGFESVLCCYKAVVYCLITYVDFFVANIKLRLSDP
jgi:hypothetical protein